MNNESGFTLIDVLVVLAVSAVIAFGAGMTTVQLIGVNRSSQEQAALAVQPQSLGYWLNQDLSMAMAVVTTDDPETTAVEFATMEWKDWESGEMFRAIYTWVNSAQPTQGIVRTKDWYDIDGDLVDSSSTRIANDIASVSVTTPQNDYNAIILGAISGDRSASRQYEIDNRPE